MAARQLAAQRRRLGDGEDRRVGMGAVRNAERTEVPQQFIGGQPGALDMPPTMRPCRRRRKPGTGSEVRE